MRSLNSIPHASAESPAESDVYDGRYPGYIAPF